MRDPDAMLSPHQVLKQIAEAVPEDLHANIVVIGSLAAAYWLLDRRRGVRTKDVDSVVSPRVAKDGRRAWRAAFRCDGEDSHHEQEADCVR